MGCAFGGKKNYAGAVEGFFQFVDLMLLPLPVEDGVISLDEMGVEEIEEEAIALTPFPPAPIEGVVGEGVSEVHFAFDHDDHLIVVGNGGKNDLIGFELPHLFLRYKVREFVAFVFPLGGEGEALKEGDLIHVFFDRLFQVYGEETLEVGAEGLVGGCCVGGGMGNADGGRAGGELF